MAEQIVYFCSSLVPMSLLRMSSLPSTYFYHEQISIVNIFELIKVFDQKADKSEKMIPASVYGINGHNVTLKRTRLG